MKKILIFMCMIFVLGFLGCDEATEDKTEDESIFVFIETNTISKPFAIVYHKETKVMYAVSGGAYNSGQFTLLVNPDGTPMIYEEEKGE